MNSKMIGILASLIVVFAIAVVLNNRDGSTSDESIGQLLIPELKAQLPELSSVEISVGDQKVSFTNKGSYWGVNERADYPVNFATLSAMITDLSEAKIIERKTSREENLNRLGLSGDKVVEVVVTSGSGTFKVLLGDEPASRKGHYVRFPDDNQAWLIDRQIEAKTSLSEWLDPIVINIDSERVKRVILNSPLGERTEVERVEGEDNLRLVGMRPGQKLKYPAIANDIAGALVNVRLKDVVLDKNVNWSQAWKAEFYLDDGSKVYVTTVPREQKYLMRVKVEQVEKGQLETKLAETDEAKVETEKAEGNEAEVQADKEESSKGDMDLAKYQNLDQYVFEISDFVSDEFSKTSKDLIE